MLSFSSCGNKKDDNCTYEELTDEQKEIVDLVYSYYDNWNYIQDSGDDWGCTNVTFFYQSDRLMFATYYEFSPMEKVGYGVSSKRGSTAMFDVEITNARLLGHEYSVYESAEKRNALVKASMGYEFDVNADEEIQKDILANAYYENIVEEE